MEKDSLGLGALDGSPFSAVSVRLSLSLSLAGMTRPGVVSLSMVVMAGCSCFEPAKLAESWS